MFIGTAMSFGFDMVNRCGWNSTPISQALLA